VNAPTTFGADLVERDADGVAHIVPVSGGHDSTLVALLLREREPRLYNYLCTPTGDELPELFDFWRWLSGELGRRILPIMEGRGLLEWSRQQKAIPNWRMRHCTPGLKIAPLARFLSTIAGDGPVVLYIGLRADEPARAGAVYPALPSVEQRFPLREWNFDDAAVLAELEQRDVLWRMAERTDCARCYHQQIGEWWRLWHGHRDLFVEAVEFESEMGATFRTPRLEADGSPVMVTRYGLTFAACWRDTWPVRLADLQTLFERGHVPTARADPRARDLFRGVGACRACTL
jgi:hypothetical protein